MSIKLKSPNFIKSRDRESYAKSFAAMLTLHLDDFTQIPYKPNPSENDFWTLDYANNWKLKFDPDAHSFEIYYRYPSDEMNSKLEILKNWLIARFGFQNA